MRILAPQKPEFSLGENHSRGQGSGEASNPGSGLDFFRQASPHLIPARSGEAPRDSEVCERGRNGQRRLRRRVAGSALDRAPRWEWWRSRASTVFLHMDLGSQCVHTAGALGRRVGAGTCTEAQRATRCLKNGIISKSTAWGCVCVCVCPRCVCPAPGV